jgi:hypothetical protein
MAVRADDIALIDLGEDVFPWSFPQAFADAEPFLAEVVELQDERIALSAVHAWMLAKERDEIGSPFADDPLGAAAGRIDVVLLVAGTVLVPVRGSTGPAVVVTLPTGFSTPGEFIQWLLLLAAPTKPHAKQHIDTNRRSYRALKRHALEKRRTGIEPASSPWKGEALPLSYRRASESSP